MPAHLAEGYRVADRYRLESELGRGDAAIAWRATDERLERQVALSVYGESIDTSKLQERAGRAASLTHPRVVRIFDTGIDSGRFFTVRELLPGALAWARLPLPPPEAVDIGIEIAEALAYAHARGVTHGGLHAGNVLLSEQGVKVADFGLSARSLGAGPSSASDDLADLGRLLYHLVTGARPGRSTAHSRPLPDSPKGLARIVSGLMEGGYEDAARLAEDLRGLRPPAATEVRRRPAVLLAAVAAVLVGLAAFGLTRLGERGEPQPSATEAPAVVGTPLRIASVADFDPQGDGREGRATVAKISDGDRQTFWATERYRDDPKFSGLKSGVGVIIDLDSPKTVGRSQVFLAAPGCSFELRFSPVRARDVDDWRVATRVSRAGSRATTRFGAATSRWWLIWVTELTQGVPGARDAYACGIAEAELYPP